MQRKIFIALTIFIALLTYSLAAAKGPVHLNIILISIDTIRSDHIGCYGYKKIKTPNMDQLAKKGILFENTFSPVPLTLPSHASILTGTYPAFHGIRNNGTYALSESAVTLAELLKDHGYVTAAFVSSYVLDKRFGLDQGFDVYNDELSIDNEQGLFGKERCAEAVTNATIQWLKKLSNSSFFLWVHYFDPHMHYKPPPPFCDDYANNLYDGEIAYTDSWLGVLIATLHELDFDENTLIVLTGDHGEGLGEHQEKEHGIFIYDSTLQVPLIFSCPKLFPKSFRCGSLVRLIDIAPTILDIAGYKSHGDMQGVSLLSLMKSNVKDLNLVLYCESFYPQFSHNWSPLEGIRTQKWKYIEAPIKELYQLDKDPSENTNIFDQEQAKVKEMALELSKVQERITSSDAMQDAQRIPLDKHTKEKLRSLGYVFTPAIEKEKGEYPDPKKMIGMLEYVEQGLEYFGKANYQKAADKFLKILQTHPQDVDTYTILGHTYEAMEEEEKSLEAFEKAIELGCRDLRIYIKLGTSYLKLNRYKQGISTLHKALEINPRCKEVYTNLALHYLQIKEDDQAIAQFQKALEIDPYDVVIYNHLAAIYQKYMKYDQAISTCKTVLDIDPNNIPALLILGSTLLYRHRYKEASDALQKAIEIKPDSLQALYFSGLVSFQQNKLDEAIGFFNQAIQFDPNWAEPHFNLGFIYQKQKNLTQALDEYQTALELKPDLTDARKLIEQVKLQLQRE